MSTSMIGGLVTRTGFLGMMICLGIKLGLHPGMSLAKVLHLHLHCRIFQNRASVTVAELPSSSTSGSEVKFLAMTSGPPPGIERTSSLRATGNTSIGINSNHFKNFWCWQLCTFGTSFDPNL